MVCLRKVSYKESVGVKTDRIAPTIGDLTRVRDLKGLKDLVHKPKVCRKLWNQSINHAIGVWRLFHYQLTVSEIKEKEPRTNENENKMCSDDVNVIF